MHAQMQIAGMAQAGCGQIEDVARADQFASALKFMHTHNESMQLGDTRKWWVKL